MKINDKMYSTLFNSITDIHEKLMLANKMIEESISALENAQIDAEEVYISSNDEQ